MFHLFHWLNKAIDRINSRSQILRSRIFKPLLKILLRFGVTANRLTNFRIVLGLVFLAVSFFDVALAGIILIIALCLDEIDGSLARFEKKASDKGKFLDMFADSVIYSFVLISSAMLSAMAYPLMYNLFIVPVAYLLAVVYYNELKLSDWIIKPYAKCSHLKFVVVVPYLVFVFTGINFIYWGLWISNIMATLMSIFFYFSIQLRWKRRFSH